MSVAYGNLLDAMVGWLRSTPAVVAAFGDDPSSLETDKFGPIPLRKADLPWAAYADVGGEVQYMTSNDTIETGGLQFVVVANGKDIAESLVRLLVKTLNDAPLVFMSGRLMYLRAGSPSAVPVGDLAPNCPNAYAYAVTMNSMVQGTV